MAMTVRARKRVASRSQTIREQFIAVFGITVAATQRELETWPRRSSSNFYRHVVPAAPILQSFEPIVPQSLWYVRSNTGWGLLA